VPLAADMALTQGRLQDYVECARRFQLRNIERLRSPALEVKQALAYEQRLRQGQRFHTLVLQHIHGTAPDRLAQSLHDDPELAQWWATYRRLGLDSLPGTLYPEIALQTQLAGFRLLAKFDLLALEPGGDAVIVDWKTSTAPPQRARLRAHMQTIVYRFVLARAASHLYGDVIAPEHIRMDYVFVAQDGHRERFDYSAAEMAADEARLQALLQEIHSAEHFPLTQELRSCRFCSYRALCERGEAGDIWELEAEVEAEMPQASTLDFDQIEEIAY